jgi:uncharacterized protein
VIIRKILVVDLNTILEFGNRIAQEYKPVRIILFGSYANGTPSPESDVDILVILPFEGKSALKSAELLNRTNPRFPIDLLVRTPDQVQDRLQKGDFFMKEIIEKGVVIYEAPDA